MAPDLRRRLVRSAAGVGASVALLALLLLWQPSGLYLWLKSAHVIAIIA